MPSLTERVRKGEDATGKERRQGQSGQDQGFQRHKQEPEAPADPAKLDQAVERFAEDATSQAYGLQAEVAGNGPGLRVTLRDGTGAIVRQFTGQEFLEMREAASATGRGRLLDKKL